jgi:hypothetical protein
MGKIAVANSRDRVLSPAVRLSDGWCRIQSIRTPGQHRRGRTGPADRELRLLPAARPPSLLRNRRSAPTRRWRKVALVALAFPSSRANVRQASPLARGDSSKWSGKLRWRIGLSFDVATRRATAQYSERKPDRMSRRRRKEPRSGFVRRSRLLKLEPSRAREKLRAVQVSPSRSS